MTEPIRVPVTLLTGFLGAGKSSLLNRLLAEPGFGDSAVIVNEFGAVGLDGDLVAHADGQAFAMTTGCLCCTVAGDIRLTLLRLAEEAATGRGPAFSRLVIETTGLADPAPVLHALMTSDLVIDRYALNGVVTVVDAVAGAATLDRFAEARAQAAVADLLLISKTDLAPDSAALEARLAALNPNARLLRAAEAGPAEIFGLAAFDLALKPPEVADWLRFEGHGQGHGQGHGHGHGHGHDPNRHGSDIEAFCYTGVAPVGAWDVQDLIETLQEALGPDLLRLKAIACLDEDPERPVILHAVQHVLHPPSRPEAWPRGPRETRIIVIARGAGREAVPEAFARFLPSLAPWQAPQPSEPGTGIRPATR
ncbi:MAG: GTP-binding protein [Amaricoccus sp.]